MRSNSRLDCGVLATLTIYFHFQGCENILCLLLTYVTENIPFSLELRIVRICSHPEDREKRFDELKALLISRAYKPITGMIRKHLRSMTLDRRPAEILSCHQLLSHWDSILEAMSAVLLT